MNIAGRFFKIPEYQKQQPDGKTVVGLIGSAYIEGLTKENIEFIKAFYMVPNRSHRTEHFYPVTVNQNVYNGFIIIG